MEKAKNPTSASNATENVIFFNEAKARKVFSEAYSSHINGEIDEAIQLYEESLKWCPTAEAYTFLGWALSSRKEYEKAIAYCKLAIALDPDYGNPYNDIGAYLIETGFADDAIEWLKKAIAAKRYDCRFYSYYNLGKIYEEKNQIVKALNCFENAIEINPEFLAAMTELEKLKNRLN